MKNVENYFKLLGFNCPPLINIFDFLLELISIDSRS